MDSPFKTPSKVLPSSSSSSPFTPKRSLIKKKNCDGCSQVSRTLSFDDSNITSPFKGNVDFLPLSQPLPREHEYIQSEPTTPVKIENAENSVNILYSPNIKNRPKKFNISDQEISFIKPSPSKRCGSNRSTPSKKLKANVMVNSKPITHYFKPVQKRQDYMSHKNDCISSDTQELNEENMNSETENRIKRELFTDDMQSSKSNITITNQSINQSSQSLQFKNSNERVKEMNKIGNNSIIPSLKKNLSLSLPKEKKMILCTQSVSSSFSDTKVEDLYIIEQVTPRKNSSINNTVLKSPSINDYLENKVTISGGDTYSRFIKFIVLKAEIICFGKREIMKKIESSTDDELKIYGRLISRKHGWIRFNGQDGLQKYKDLNLCYDFEDVLMSLETKQLIDTDVMSCELDCLLNILKSNELKDLQKTFNINQSSSKSKTKPEMIKSFINLVKNQRTIFGNSISNIKESVKKKLEYCLKLSDVSRDDIMSCLIYESYPYFSGEEKDRFRECFTKFSLVEKNELKFPTFKTERVSINFSSKDSLEMYKTALNLRYKIQLSLEQKDHENTITLLKIVFEKIKFALCDQCTMESLSKIPTYMRKYSAVSVYASLLFKNITTLKKSVTDKDLPKEVLEFLLNSKELLVSKRAELHIELAKVFDAQYKKTDSAAKVILSGLKEDTMSELDRQMLSNRAMIYANRKVRKLDDESKKELLSIVTIAKKELPSVTINGTIVSLKEKGSSGRKQVFSKRTGNGDLLCMSVEELAISHYKSQGFSYGIHDEGQFIKSMFLLCFWDIIYGSYPPHVLFIRKYQDCPLDWRTRHFYSIRKQQIESRMVELKLMNVEQICDLLKERCDEYLDTQSVINWKFMNVDNLQLCRTFLECVGIDVFLAIGNQILKDGRIYLHGMPDLVVWDVVKHKCMFVEVKGPNDKLSERQTSWLHKLIDFGANVEVCHVVGNGGKKSNYENMD